MTDRFEQSLITAGLRSVGPPRVDDFVIRLRSEIGRRRAARQKHIASATALFLVLVVSVVSFQNLRLHVTPDYLAGYEFLDVFELNEEDLSYEEWYVDEAFVLEAMDYLIEKTDLASTNWELVNNLDELGLVDVFEVIQREG